ncbi:amidase [Sphingosinicella rhizophila]|uniref:Amidase n=1 Tax=Sphingosinicella rhizophila TaxID=3050082 RepID=A0ABU3Q4N4_9SPHN|nr:amidase [Sphingosinicella sp. GR2756]MDT9598380.1 amidase [Sphingosinicella sp. GR2756]
MRAFCYSLLLSAAAAAALAAQAAPKVEEQSIDQLQAAMASGTTSEAITRAYLDRIAAMDRNGPTLRAVIAVAPNALDQAQASDARRKTGRTRGPLDGVPILIKDNIETRELPTTAGSLALKNNRTGRDAPVVAELRRAGAVILGKANLSEWANIRAAPSISGWSAVGGLVRNPHALDRSACGSSSGSGAAVAASFAAAALGSDTAGSIICPASMNGIVGLKPTLGMVSRTHVVPISHSQDMVGPMARSVRDVAILFSAMVAEDPADPTTRDAAKHKKDFAAGLSADALKGVRMGVVRPEMPPAIREEYDRALTALRAAGAILVDVDQPKADGLFEALTTVLRTELKAGLGSYLATTPAAVTARTLEQVIAFNAATPEEMAFIGQEIFVEAAKTSGLDDAGYRDARAKSLRLAGSEGIDAMLKQANATILIQPSYDVAWLADPIYRDTFNGLGGSVLPAIAGYPHLTVPMGLVKGLPVGLSFIATAFGDEAVLKAGHAYEQASRARTPPRYLPTADVGAGLEGAR